MSQSADILGPFDHKDFETMKQLKKSVKILTDTDKTKYAPVIKSDKKLLNKYLTRKQ